MNVPASAADNAARLAVPAAVQRGVAEFVAEVAGVYGASLLAVIAFGSAVTGDYEPGESDVNLLVVDAALDIDDLERVGSLSRRFLRTSMLAPRFLSKRNFDDYVRHFQVDLLAMRGSSLVLCGRDLLQDAVLGPHELRWQAGYEVKAMRLRIKQQFWRVEGDPRALRNVLVQRFTSLTHLMRAALALNGHEAPVRRADVVSAAVRHLAIDDAFTSAVTALRRSRDQPDRETLLRHFRGLLEAIRVVDAAIEAAPR